MKAMSSADTTLPNISILSPRNRTYNNQTTIDIKYIAIDNVAIHAIWYEVKNYTGSSIIANTTISENTSFTMPKTGTNFTFFLYANDTAGNTNATQNVTFNVTNSHRYVKYEKFHGKGQTTNLDALNITSLENISNLTFEEPSRGKINFLSNVNLSNVSADYNGNNVTLIDSFVNISSNRVEINSSAVPGLNVSANITLDGLSYTNPRILKDSSVCSSEFCTEQSYSGGTFVFNVSGFSIYTTEETPSTSSSSSGSDNRVSSSSSGGETKKSWKTTFFENEREFSEYKVLEESLEKNQRVIIKFKEEDHYIGILNISDKTIEIEVSSKPQQEKLEIGKFKKFDLDSDNIYDLKVTLQSINKSKANTADIILEYIGESNEKVLEKDKTENFEKEEISSPKISTNMIIGTIIFILIMAFLIFSKSPHKKNIVKIRHKH